MAGKIFSDVYTEAARDTGDLTASHITYVKKKANDALREICGQMRYAWLQREVNLTLVASQQAYAMSVASNWDEDTPVGIYYRDNANKRRYLDCYDDEEWKNQDDLDEGDPYGFNINMKSGSWKAYLSYVPSSNFVSSYSPMVMEYQKKPTELSADADVPEIPTSHHQALVWWTNKLICVEMGDTESASSWQKLADDSLGLLKKKQVNRVGRAKRAYPRGYLSNGGNGRQRKDYNR
jgi:hypothetical protein